MLGSARRVAAIAYNTYREAVRARILLGLARDKGFKGIVANRGQSALALARQKLGG